MTSSELEPKAMAALSFLHEKAVEHAQHKANVEYLEGYLKVKRAELKGVSTASSNAAAEDDALRHPDYVSVLEALKTAHEIHYTAVYKRDAAQTIISVWQSLCANERTRIL